jgi:hypothetical protein
MTTSFRIGLKVDYTSANGVWPEFTLNSIDFDDPCIYDDTTEVNCNMRGKCKREEGGKIFNCTPCSTPFTGLLCDQIDYCKKSQNVSISSSWNYDSTN